MSASDAVAVMVVGLHDTFINSLGFASDLSRAACLPYKTPVHDDHVNVESGALAMRSFRQSVMTHGGGIAAAGEKSKRTSQRTNDNDGKKSGAGSGDGEKDRKRLNHAVSLPDHLARQQKRVQMNAKRHRQPSLPTFPHGYHKRQDRSVARSSDGDEGRVPILEIVCIQDNHDGYLKPPPSMSAQPSARQLRAARIRKEFLLNNADAASSIERYYEEDEDEKNGICRYESFDDATFSEIGSWQKEKKNEEHDDETDNWSTVCTDREKKKNALKRGQ